MKKYGRHGSRGQAVFETAIAVPLFLIGLFGVIWAFRTGMLSEQVQQSVRYGGLVSALSNPYEQFSLYTAYQTIDNIQPPHERDCVGGASNVVSQGHSNFWQASSGSISSSPTCGLVILFPASGVTSPVFLYSDYVNASASPQSEGARAWLSGNNITNASQNFFRSPDVAILIVCSHIGYVAKLSLEGESDTLLTPITPPTPFPQTVTATASDLVTTYETNNCLTTNANLFGPVVAPY